MSVSYHRNVEDPWAESPTVLVAEDELLVREVIVDYLRVADSGLSRRGTPTTQ